MNKLRVVRLDRGLSQYELAAASGVPRYVIQLAETATRSPSFAHRLELSSALGVPQETIFPDHLEEEEEEVNSEVVK